MANGLFSSKGQKVNLSKSHFVIFKCVSAAKEVWNYQFRVLGCVPCSEIIIKKSVSVVR